MTFIMKLQNCKKCFGDPLHTTDSISEMIIEDIYIDKVLIGKIISNPNK